MNRDSNPWYVVLTTTVWYSTVDEVETIQTFRSFYDITTHLLVVMMMMMVVI